MFAVNSFHLKKKWQSLNSFAQFIVAQSSPLPWYYHVIFTVDMVLSWNFPCPHGNYCGYHGITAFFHYHVIVYFTLTFACDFWHILLMSLCIGSYSVFCVQVRLTWKRLDRRETRWWTLNWHRCPIPCRVKRSSTPRVIWLTFSQWFPHTAVISSEYSWLWCCCCSRVESVVCDSYLVSALEALRDAPYKLTITTATSCLTYVLYVQSFFCDLYP